MLRNLIVSRGFDRVRFWVDTPDLPFDLESLSCKATIHLQSMPYSPAWQLSVDLHQPRLADLDKLCTLEVRCGVQIASAEVAIDVEPLRGITAEKLAHFVLGHCADSGGRTRVTPFEGTFYSRPRGQKCLAIYYDKPSKLADRASSDNNVCCHMEMRLTSKQALQQARLVTLRDFIDFNHCTFWRRTLHSLKITDSHLARLVIEEFKDNSKPRSLDYVAKRWKESYKTSDVFCLQNAWIDPKARAILKKLPATDLFKLLSRLDNRITRREPSAY